MGCSGCWRRLRIKDVDIIYVVDGVLCAKSYFVADTITKRWRQPGTMLGEQSGQDEEHTG